MEGGGSSGVVSSDTSVDGRLGSIDEHNDVSASGLRDRTYENGI